MAMEMIPSLRDHSQLLPKYRIFLSHAGTEKNFTEQLYEDLCNIYPNKVFLDNREDCLPRGEPFPKHIFQSAKDCELAIVVVSNDYFMRKWPMQELAAFVRAQNHKPLTILPLFFKLSVEQFKQSANQGCWDDTWRKWAAENSRIDMDTTAEWKKILRTLSSLNGIVYTDSMGEVYYRKKIVEEVCKLLVPDAPYDVTLKDKDKRDILKWFREESGTLDEMQPTCYFGMYGVGGIDNTILSKVLCNELLQDFSGKVCHVKLGREGVPREDVQMEVLGRLTSCNITGRQFMRDQAQRLLMEHIPRHRVFLVIDNVECIERSQREAEFYLSLPFKTGSVVLVTARTSETLHRLGVVQGWTKPLFPKPTLHSISSWIDQLLSEYRLMVAECKASFFERPLNFVGKAVGISLLLIGIATVFVYMFMWMMLIMHPMVAEEAMDRMYDMMDHMMDHMANHSMPQMMDNMGKLTDRTDFFNQNMPPLKVWQK